MKNFTRLFIGHFFRQFVNNFIVLLRKINDLKIFNFADFFQIFVASQNTEILIDANFCFGMFVTYIINNFRCSLQYLLTVMNTKHRLNNLLKSRSYLTRHRNRHEFLCRIREGRKKIVLAISAESEESRLYSNRRKPRRNEETR